ncbi:hypothetical protein BH18THE2_BH18THE2_43680 [soil metagenome]
MHFSDYTINDNLREKITAPMTKIIDDLLVELKVQYENVDTEWT